MPFPYDKWPRRSGRSAALERLGATKPRPCASLSVLPHALDHAVRGCEAHENEIRLDQSYASASRTPAARLWSAAPGWRSRQSQLASLMQWLHDLDANGGCKRVRGSGGQYGSLCRSPDRQTSPSLWRTPAQRPATLAGQSHRIDAQETPSMLLPPHRKRVAIDLYVCGRNGRQRARVAAGRGAIALSPPLVAHLVCTRRTERAPPRPCHQRNLSSLCFISVIKARCRLRSEAWPRLAASLRLPVAVPQHGGHIAGAAFQDAAPAAVGETTDAALYQVEGGLATITLNQPTKNACP